MHLLARIKIESRTAADYVNPFSKLSASKTLQNKWATATAEANTKMKVKTVAIAVFALLAALLISVPSLGFGSVAVFRGVVRLGCGELARGGCKSAAKINRLFHPPMLANDEHAAPIRYVKGEQRTRDLIPARKKAFASGAVGKIYHHRDYGNCVVKKAGKSLEREFNIGVKVRHPHVVGTHGLYIKSYPKKGWQKKQKQKHKLLLERIDGQTMLQSYKKANKISGESICKLLSQAQECCSYLFDQKIVWADVNCGNIFSTNDGNLKICDLDFWSVDEDPKARALKLFLGSVELSAHLVKNLLMEEGQKKQSAYLLTEKECAFIFPEEFFAEKVTEKFVPGSAYGIECYSERSWLKTMAQRVATMDEAQLKAFLDAYFKQVIAKISAELGAPA